MKTEYALMTESEWLSCQNSYLMVKHVVGTTEEPILRKCRLLAVALCRLAWNELSPVAKECVELAEIAADNPDSELAHHPFGNAVIYDCVDFAARPVRDVGKREHRSRKAAVSCHMMDTNVSACLIEVLFTTSQLNVKQANQTDTIRHMVGNPWQCKPKNIYCKTAARAFDIDVEGLANMAYQERLADGSLEPGRLAVLADALEESMCVNQEFLDHLRSPGPHYRGCWALDLVLGKE